MYSLFRRHCLMVNLFTSRTTDCLGGTDLATEAEWHCSFVPMLVHELFRLATHIALNLLWLKLSRQWGNCWLRRFTLLIIRQGLRLTSPSFSAIKTSY